MRKWRFGVCILFSLLLILQQAYGTGLATSFVDVVARDVPLGKPVRVEDYGGKDLMIWNTNNTPLIVHLQALKPEAQELRGSAEAIEEAAWITIHPNVLTLGPHETRHCEVVVTLPRDPHLRGRIFQAMIWSQSEAPPGDGVSVNVGLKSRLQIRTMR